jgi:hypothetical protein
LQHPKEPNHCVECIIISGQKALSHFFSEAVFNDYVVEISPSQKQHTELLPVLRVTLAPEWPVGEPAVAFGWIGLGNHKGTGLEQGLQLAVERPEPG